VLHLIESLLSVISSHSSKDSFRTSGKIAKTKTKTKREMDSFGILTHMNRVMIRFPLLFVASPPFRTR